MGRSQNSFMKKQREKKKQKKKEEKMQRKQERQENSSGGALDEMVAYVDEYGNITSTPPEEDDLSASQRKNPNSKDPLKK
ncbi:S-adenosylmethionine hydrolase [Catalinimonas alkaloidigena]|nr:S-adenosylmethionine hydrolase [Catalinimonas alkaloidigena]